MELSLKKSLYYFWLGAGPHAARNHHVHQQHM